jgi:hypothetical protein
MANPIYAHYSDEIGHLVTAVLSSGTADANYPVTKVNNGDPADVFLTSSTATIVNIDFDSGSAVDAKLLTIHHHNLPAGTVVTITRGATQGAATMTGTITIATYPNTGLPLPQRLDLTALGSYGNYRWTRVSVPSLAQKVGIGNIGIWNQQRQDIRNLLFPFRRPEQSGKRVFPTGYRHKRRLRLGFRFRWLDGAIHTTASDYATFLTWFRTWSNDIKPFLFILDPAVDDAWLAEFGEDTIVPEANENNNTPIPVVIEELACGPAIPTS